jgi:hypothetical protein
LSFEVDGSVAETYTASVLDALIYHVPLWASPTLDEGEHTLVITQTTAVGSQGAIFLDYLIYNTTSPTAGPYFIDDRDPRITYTPPWQDFLSDSDFQYTSQGSISAGDSFSLRFEGV